MNLRKQRRADVAASGRVSALPSLVDLVETGVLTRERVEAVG